MAILKKEEWREKGVNPTAGVLLRERVEVVEEEV